jgi:DNA mismatch repair protein MutS
MDRVKNYTVAIKEWNDQIIFLRRVVEGGADKSYGIQVARLAGLPEAVIQRAREVLANLETAEFNDLGKPRLGGASKIGTAERANGARGEKNTKAGKAAMVEPQLGLFASEAGLIFKEIADLDLDAMTPLDAMNTLHDLKKKVSGS